MSSYRVRIIEVRLSYARDCTLQDTGVTRRKYVQQDEGTPSFSQHLEKTRKENSLKMRTGARVYSKYFEGLDAL